MITSKTPEVGQVILGDCSSWTQFTHPVVGHTVFERVYIKYHI